MNKPVRTWLFALLLPLALAACSGDEPATLAGGGEGPVQDDIIGPIPEDDGLQGGEATDPGDDTDTSSEDPLEPPADDEPETTPVTPAPVDLPVPDPDTDANPDNLEDTPPADESQPEEDTPPADESQPEEDTPPADESQPEEDTPPADESQPEEDTPPADESQPEEDTPPADESQPEEDAPPADESQPEEDSPPADESQPEEDAPPADDTQAGEDSEPADETQPEADSESDQETQTEPEEAAQSDGNANDDAGSPDPFNGYLETQLAVAPADGLPSVPQHLRVDLIGNDWVELNWTPAADNGEIVEYRLYRDDGVVFNIRGDQTDPSSGTQNEINKFWQTTSFIDCNFTRFADRIHQCAENAPEPGSAHSYQISAVDNDGNESARSDWLFVQLYSEAGAPVEPYSDIYLDGDDEFPFTTNFASTDNFLGQFELVFADEFNGAEIDASKWNTSLTWGHTEGINGEQQYFVDTLQFPDFGYNPFKFNGSTLSIDAIRTPSSLNNAALGQPFLSGALSSHDKFGFTYGYAESRMKVGGVSGQLSSFYLFRRWQAEHSPEIDIVEYLGENPFGDEDAFQTYHFRDTVHGVTRSSPTMFAKKSAGNFSDDFHVFGVLWEPGLVIWYIDNQEVKRLSGPQIGRQQMNIVTYLVTGSEWAPTPDVTADIFPLRFEIDYIRVYQRPPYIR